MNTNIHNHESIAQIQLYLAENVKIKEIRCLNFTDPAQTSKTARRFFDIKSIDQYTSILPELIELNENRQYNIFLTTGRSDFLLLDDISGENVEKIRKNMNIFYILETSVSNFQVVLKASEQLDKEQYDMILNYLKYRYNADINCRNDIGRIHRIAGFRNQKQKYIACGTNIQCQLIYVDSKTLNEIDITSLLWRAIADKNYKEYVQKKEIKKNKNQKNIESINITDTQNIDIDQKLINFVRYAYNERKRGFKGDTASEIDFYICAISFRKKFSHEQIYQAIKTYRPAGFSNHTNIDNYIKLTIAAAEESNRRYSYY